MTIAVSFIVLVIVSIGFFTYEFLKTRSSIIYKVSTLAKVIGTNCYAAVMFKDTDAARESLSTLSAEPNILSAHIHAEDRRLFVSYFNTPPTQQHYPSREKETCQSDTLDYIRFSGLRLSFGQAIMLGIEPIGAICITYSLKRFYMELAQCIALGFLILILCTGLAYVLSSRLQRRISEPIFELVDTMGEISKSKDYALRVEKHRHDEIGSLFDGFNDMLAQIQHRDQTLHLTQFAVDSAADAVYWMRSNGSLFYVNHTAGHQLGYDTETLLEMSIFDIHSNITVGEWPKLFRKCNVKKSITFEGFHQCHDGSDLPVEVVFDYIEYQDQAYICAHARDISERKQLESKLERAQKMEAIGSLAAGVAHDLNNILGGIVTYPQLMMMDMPQSDPMWHNLKIIEESGTRAASIVQDMLTLARRGVAARELVQVGNLVNEFLQSPEFNKIVSNHPNLNITTTISQNLFNIKGSVAHLSHVIMNLVVNSAEAMPNRGNCEITVQPRYVEKDQARGYNLPEGDYVILSVIDSGVGISEEEQKNIFEPFYTKKSLGRSGTGLGMTVVLATVTDHKGHIEVSSQIGKGTRFDLYFPATRDSVESIPICFEFEDHVGTESILVVDDIQEQRDIASGILKKFGYQVTSVSNGEAAVDFIRNYSVDLVVLDMIMEGGMDGLDTYKVITSIKPNQKAIIASGYAENERIREAMKLGCGRYVKKPYTVEMLVTAARKELNKTEA